MIEEHQIKNIKAKDITKKTPGRPKLMTGGHITINVRLPVEWEKKKEESGRVWRYIIGKGLETVLGFEDQITTKLNELQAQSETQGRIIRRLHEQKIELQEELENLKKKLEAN